MQALTRVLAAWAQLSGQGSRAHTMPKLHLPDLHCNGLARAPAGACTPLCHARGAATRAAVAGLQRRTPWQGGHR